MSGPPADEWLQFFKGETDDDTSVAVRWAVNVRGVRLQFTSSPDNVAQGLHAIDLWITRANGRYRSWLQETHRKGDARRRDEETDADRVRGLNDRFKDL